ncbi:PEP-utilizing enzyme [Crocosphaera sp.]|nr:hypothetical protein [Crocosphaera sp.]
MLRLGVPVIIDFKEATANIREGAIITVDAEKGQVYSGLVTSNNNGNK